ncbi:glycerate kinase [Hydrogenophaga sp.]|uniref:glycerate kinase n=1 Tax=Hydrogenophaga sp. TaxID=1904254 RepID=UPI00199ACDD2|nr:glycerate kinase [Hydrogenophaga sp.]MBD3893856.1 glycerate kinase [Hydrogenophaga sp.]
MTLRKLFVALAAALLLVLAHRAYGWPGVAAVSGGLLMWLLLHVTRLLTVLQRAAQRPLGHIDSAVMLNARLRVGASLLHVLAQTRSLGVLESAAGEQPERYRWSDNSGSALTAEFRSGRLLRWTLLRPNDGTPAAPPPDPSQPPVQPPVQP